MKHLLLIMTILTLALSSRGQVKCHIEGDIFEFAEKVSNNHTIPNT